MVKTIWIDSEHSWMMQIMGVQPNYYRMIDKGVTLLGYSLALKLHDSVTKALAVSGVEVK